MKKRLFLICLIILLSVKVATAVDVSLLTVNLKGQQTVNVRCNGDELLVYPISDDEMQITCRVWVSEEE